MEMTLCMHAWKRRDVVCSGGCRDVDGVKLGGLTIRWDT